MYYDSDGQPMEMMAWAKAQTPEHKRVAEDTIEVAGKSYWVSTVWLGLDHSFGLGGPPLIFETMAFCGPKPGKDSRLGPCVCDADGCELMDRYATKEEALAGHQEICERVRTNPPAKEDPDE